MLFGFLLIALGIIFLLKNLGLMPEIAWDIAWPILLIVLGLSFIFKKGKKF